MDFRAFSSSSFGCVWIKMPDCATGCNCATMVAGSPLSQLGLYRPIKNIRFIIGEGGSAGRRCQSPERSGAYGRGSEQGGVVVYVPRGAAHAGLTAGADRSGRLRRETNVRKEDQPKAVPLNL